MRAPASQIMPTVIAMISSAEPKSGCASSSAAINSATPMGLIAPENFCSTALR